MDLPTQRTLVVTLKPPTVEELRVTHSCRDHRCPRNFSSMQTHQVLDHHMQVALLESFLETLKSLPCANISIAHVAWALT